MSRIQTTLSWKCCTLQQTRTCKKSVTQTDRNVLRGHVDLLTATWRKGLKSRLQPVPAKMSALLLRSTSCYLRSMSLCHKSSGQLVLWWCKTWSHSLNPWRNRSEGCIHNLSYQYQSNLWLWYTCGLDRQPDLPCPWLHKLPMSAG